MKTHTFTMAALAAGVALALSAQVQGQVVVFPKVVTSATGFVCTNSAVGVDIASTSGNKGTLVTDNVVLNILLTGSLASAIDAAVTTIPLASATGFAFPGSVKIESEIITYTGITGNNLTGATRGALVTPANPAPHASGAAVNLQVLGTQNDITVPAGGVITVPEAFACNLDGKSCKNPTTACAAQTCDNNVCTLPNDVGDGKACTTAADCAAQTCDGTGAPDCAVNPTILKEATTFGYEPASCCAAGSCPGTCTGLRALVFSMKSAGSKAPIANGKVLYTCKIAIGATAADGSYPLANSLQVASDQSGNSICAGGSDGAVTVPGVITPTISPSPTPTITPGGPTFTPKGTNTSGPSVTPEKTRTRTPGGGGGRNNDDDSCSIVSPANGHSGWMLLLPAAALLWIRRRSR